MKIHTWEEKKKWNESEEYVAIKTLFSKEDNDIYKKSKVYEEGEGIDYPKH